MVGQSRRIFGRPIFLIPFCAVFAAFAVLEGSGLAAPARPPVPAFSGEDLYRGIILVHGPVAEMIPEIRDQLMPARFVNDRRLLRAIEMFQDRLIEEIGSAHPQFFAEFAAAMQSGDHLVVLRGLEDAARLTLETLSGMHEIAALRAVLREDPGRMRDLLNGLKHNPEAAEIDEAALQRAIEAAVAQGLEQAETPQDPYTVDSSVVVVLVAVAAIVAAITVLFAQSYAAVLNIAGAVNVALAVVAWTSLYTGGPGGGKKIARLPLQREQMVDSIVLAFGN
jgi:hypothetical protein